MNFSQNLINDISFEYYLTESGNQYVHLFRHTGFESVLEGQITTTGVGYVIKRKINDLRHLFRRSTPKPQPQPEPATGSDSAWMALPVKANDSIDVKPAEKQ